MKKALAGIVIVLLIVALGFSIFFATTHKTQIPKMTIQLKTRIKREKHKKESITEERTQEQDNTTDNGENAQTEPGNTKYTKHTTELFKPR